MKVNPTTKIILICVAAIFWSGCEESPQIEQISETSSVSLNNEAPSDDSVVSDTIPEETANEEINIALFTFSEEIVGAEPISFLPAVGYWTIGVDEENSVLFLDGSRWEQGQASANIAEHARQLYGDRYSEFLDNVQAFAYFPFAVAKDVEIFTNGEINMRFKNLNGRIDQNAGILFDLKPNGDYYTLRASSLEHNLVLWRVLRGNRSSVEWVRDVPTPSNEWHDLKLLVDGRNIQGFLNNELLLEYTLDEPVSGRVGIWSKADSEVYFDDFVVQHYDDTE